MADGLKKIHREVFEAIVREFGEEPVVTRTRNNRVRYDVKGVSTTVGLTPSTSNTVKTAIKVLRRDLYRRNHA